MLSVLVLAFLVWLSTKEFIFFFVPGNPLSLLAIQQRASEAISASKCANLKLEVGVVLCWSEWKITQLIKYTFPTSIVIYLVLPRATFDINLQGPAGDLTTVSMPQTKINLSISCIEWWPVYMDLVDLGGISWSLLRSGLLRAIQLILRLEEGSVVSSGPPCSSFVFMNSATSGRSRARPLGNASQRPYVRLANVLLDLFQGEEFW